jgi:hypothetical protein
LTPSQQAWLDTWTGEVRESIRARETTYLRDPVYDRLLGMLFPAMANALAKPRGKRTVSSRSRDRSAFFIERQPRADRASWRLLDTQPDDWWFKGRDLETWKKANPEWAQLWFGDPQQDGST